MTPTVTFHAKWVTGNMRGIFAFPLSESETQYVVCSLEPNHYKGHDVSVLVRLLTRHGKTASLIRKFISLVDGSLMRFINTSEFNPFQGTVADNRYMYSYILV